MVNNYFRTPSVMVIDIHGLVRPGPVQVFPFDDTSPESSGKAWQAVLRHTATPVLYRPCGDDGSAWAGCRLVGVVSVLRSQWRG